MVRSRVRRHLELFRELLCEELGDAWMVEGSDLPEVLETPEADYAFRLFCTREAFTAVMGWTIENIRYRNFKNQAAAEAEDPDYLPALHDVWEIMSDVQETAQKRSRR